ncbi:MAG: hypothetical protein JSR46_09110, partial [Verrucomicrobia bacterium]|nr:hypothetical protein [Verrucomicrobiota bacterium]
MITEPSRFSTFYEPQHIDPIDQPIFPKKNFGSIPEKKLEYVLSTYHYLSKKYGHLFPFSYDKDTNTVYFRTQFSLRDISQFIKRCNDAISLEEKVITFLLYTIPSIEYIAYDDLQ